MAETRLQTVKAVRAVADFRDRDAEKRTAQVFPEHTGWYPSDGSWLTIQLASSADSFLPWGKDLAGRDKQLRAFWPQETFLAGAIYTCAATHAAFDWHLEGPPRVVSACQDLLNSANLGKGWRDFVLKVTMDLLTQDNGAFVEVIRKGTRPYSPVVGINHLDAGACQRTGNREFPVLYSDFDGKIHKLSWFQVIDLAEFPSPIQSMFGAQYCAVTRTLRMAQILRDIAMYKGEKVSGRFERVIHIVGGPTNKQITDNLTKSRSEADNAGLTRFVLPVIVASLDPEKPVTHVQIDLAQLPDGFNWDDELKWYIAGLALGFGRDYQDFAPLPGKNLGSGQQSEVLHLKGQGKGPALFMRLLETAFNFQGVMPQSVTFSYDDQDLGQEKQEADVHLQRATVRKTRIDSGEISVQIARQIAQDEGDLKPEYLELMGEEDLTPDVTVDETEDANPEEIPEGAKIPEGEVPQEEEISPEEALLEEEMEAKASALASYFRPRPKAGARKGSYSAPSQTHRRLR